MLVGFLLVCSSHIILNVESRLIPALIKKIKYTTSGQCEFMGPIFIGVPDFKGWSEMKFVLVYMQNGPAVRLGTVQ